MRRSTLCLLVPFAIAALPALAWGAQGHGAEAHETVEAIPTLKQGVYTAATALVVFGIVFAVLSLKVWPVITRALDERANKIREEIDSAEMARKQARDALEQYEKSLAGARAEAQKLIEQAKAQQLAIAAELKASSEKELSAMRERAMRDIESAKRTAVVEIYTQGATLATIMAGKILQRNVTAGDTQKLVEESVAQMQSLRN